MVLIGYIPNAHNFGRGGYETHPISSPNSTQTADQLLAAAKDVIAQLAKP